MGMPELRIVNKINNIQTDSALRAPEWLALTNAIFGPLSAEDTSSSAQTKLILPDGTDRELAVGSSRVSEKGRLRFGESADRTRYGLWVPVNGVEPQSFLAEPDGEGLYGGILPRTTAGALRAGAQSMGALNGRYKEGARACKTLTNYILSNFLSTTTGALPEVPVDKLEEVLGRHSAPQLQLFESYTLAVITRLSEVAFTKA